MIRYERDETSSFSNRVLIICKAQGFFVPIAQLTNRLAFIISRLILLNKYLSVCVVKNRIKCRSKLRINAQRPVLQLLFIFRSSLLGVFGSCCCCIITLSLSHSVVSLSLLDLPSFYEYTYSSLGICTQTWTIMIIIEKISH